MVLLMLYRGSVSFTLAARAEGELLDNNQVLQMMRLSLCMVWISVFQHLLLSCPYSKFLSFSTIILSPSQSIQLSPHSLRKDEEVTRDSILTSTTTNNKNDKDLNHDKNAVTSNELEDDDEEEEVEVEEYLINSTSTHIRKHSSLQSVKTWVFNKLVRYSYREIDNNDDNDDNDDLENPKHHSIAIHLKEGE